MHLPVSEAILISSFQPAVIGIMAWILLSEPYQKVDLISGLIATLGVISVVKPDLFYLADEEVPREDEAESQYMLMVGRICMLIFTFNASFT